MKAAVGARNQAMGERIIHELWRHHVECVVFSPGSRSSSLAVALARNRNIQSVLSLDERAGAFYALGYGRSTGRVAAVLVTSGTAVANLFPAVVEASQDDIPMILLTADRPEKLRHSGANQTIDQINIFGKYTRSFYNIDCSDMSRPLSLVEEIVAQATSDAVLRRGPVQINCMFEKPFFGDSLKPLLCKPACPVGREGVGEVELDGPVSTPSDSPPTTRAGLRLQRGGDSEKHLFRLFTSAHHPLLILGSLSWKDREAVGKLANHLGWPVMADIASQLRLGPLIAEKLISFTTPITFDLILHIGGRCVENQFFEQLDRPQLTRYIYINDRLPNLNPYQLVTDVIQANVSDVCRELIQRYCKGEDALLQETILPLCKGELEGVDVSTLPHPPLQREGLYCTNNTLSEISVAIDVSRLIPANHALFLSNSMPIRDMNRFSVSDGHAVMVGCNRGASGIDGIIATATGFAAGCGRPTTVVIGDLALLHDLNSLQRVRRSPQPIIIVVINNDGGGIFSFLPEVRQTDVFETIFGTPHGLSFSSAAEMFGLRYINPKNRDEFQRCYLEAVGRNEAVVIEVASDRKKNVVLHRELDEHPVEQES